MSERGLPSLSGVQAWISTKAAVLPTSRMKPPDLRNRTSLNSSTRIRWTLSVVASTVATGSLHRRRSNDGGNRGARGTRSPDDPRGTWSRGDPPRDLRLGQAQDMPLGVSDERELGAAVRAELRHDDRAAERLRLGDGRV